MIILPYVKIGSIPFGCSVVKSKRKKPKAGDTIFIREAYVFKNKYDNPWIEVIVDNIKDNTIYFVSKI